MTIPTWITEYRKSSGGSSESFVSSSLPLHSRVTTDRFPRLIHVFSRRSRAAFEILDTPATWRQKSLSSSVSSIPTFDRPPHDSAASRARTGSAFLDAFLLNASWSCGARFLSLEYLPGLPGRYTWRGASTSAVLPTAQASRNWGIHNKYSARM